MNRIITIITVMSLLFVSCSQLKKATISNAHNVVDYDHYSYIYYLPRTKIEIKVIAVKETIIPGLYCDYAEKYFGVKDAVKEKTVNWQIKNIEITTVSEPDPDHYYIVTDNSGVLIKNNLLKFNENGMLFFPDYLNFSDSSSSIEEISVKQKKEENFNASLNLVFSDSGFIHVPKMKKEWEMKKQEEKAEQAASFLIKLHKRKFKLITGQSVSSLSGEAMTAALNELDRMEKEYMSLFFGRKIIEEYEKTYTCIPQDDKGYSRFVAFRFSANEGFLEADDMKGIPGIIELNSVNSLSALNHIKKPVSLVVENALYYRIPEKVDVTLIYNSEVFLKGRVRLHQFGVVIPYFLK